MQGKESTAAALSGVTCYNDLPYLYSSLFKIVSPTTPAGGTLSRKWSFKPSATSIDTFQTYTLEKGTATQAERMTYAVVNSLTQRWTLTEANLSGGIMGQQLVESVTITPTPTDITALPVDPKSASIYVGTSLSTNEVQTLLINGATGTFVISYQGQSTAALAVSVSTAALQTALQALTTIGTNNVTVAGTAGTSYTITGAGDLAGLDLDLFALSAFTGGPPTISQTTAAGLTKLLRVSSFELAIPDRYAFGYTLNDGDPSFSFIVPQGVEPKATIILEHDSASASLMADLRARTTKYCTIFCRGPAIETGFANNIKIAFPFKFTENARGDQAGVYSSTYTLSLMYDATLASFIQADVVCGITAL